MNGLHYHFCKLNSNKIFLIAFAHDIYHISLYNIYAINIINSWKKLYRDKHPEKVVLSETGLAESRAVFLL